MNSAPMAPAVDAAGLFGDLAGGALEVGLLEWAEETERVKSSFKIAPAAE